MAQALISVKVTVDGYPNDLSMRRIYDTQTIAQAVDFAALQLVIGDEVKRLFIDALGALPADADK